MSNKPSLRIDNARELAARLERRGEAVERAMKNRDICLYKFLGSLHQLEKQLQGMKRTEALTALKQFGAKLPTNTISLSLLLQLTYPELNSKTRSKYAAVLRYIGARKESKQKVIDFVRTNGGLNRCVEKEKKLRKKKQMRGGLGTS